MPQFDVLGLGPSWVDFLQLADRFLSPEEMQRP